MAKFEVIDFDSAEIIAPEEALQILTFSYVTFIESSLGKGKT